MHLKNIIYQALIKYSKFSINDNKIVLLGNNKSMAAYSNSIHKISMWNDEKIG